jgi:hypothetical protein
MVAVHRHSLRGPHPRHQSRLRLHELEYALKKVGCRALITETAFKTSDYIAMLRELAPELRAAEPRKLASGGLPDLQFVIRLGAEKTPGFLNYCDLKERAGQADRARLEAIAARLDFDDPINIHHQRHDRHTARHTSPPQHRQQCASSADDEDHAH